MSSKTNAIPNPLRRRRRRIKRSLTHSRRRLLRRHCPALNNGDRRDTTHTSSPCCSDVSAKLDALQSLIPPQSSAMGGGGVRQTDQLFKETADYIVVLKTQVVVLQKLVDFFGSACSHSQNAVVS